MFLLLNFVWSKDWMLLLGRKWSANVLPHFHLNGLSSRAVKRFTRSYLYACSKLLVSCLPPPLFPAASSWAPNKKSNCSLSLKNQSPGASYYPAFLEKTGGKGFFKVPHVPHVPPPGTSSTSLPVFIYPYVPSFRVRNVFPSRPPFTLLSLFWRSHKFRQVSIPYDRGDVYESLIWKTWKLISESVHEGLRRDEKLIGSIQKGWVVLGWGSQ